MMRTIAALLLSLTPCLVFAQAEGAEAPEEETEEAPELVEEEPEDPRVVEARERFRQGLALARAGNCVGALAELNASLELMERPNTLFNMARCHEELFRYDLAVASYERYLEIAAADAEDRPAVEATMRSLRTLLGTIVVQSNVDAEVWIGERVVGAAPGEVLVPGGRHSLELRAEGYVPERREVEVAGRQRVEVQIDLSQAQVTNVTEVTEQHTHQTVEVTEEGGAPPAVFFTGVGLTVAAGALALGFGAKALRSRSDAEDLNPLDRDAIEAANADTKDTALLADIFMGVTGALAVTTLVLFFLTDFDGDPEVEPAVEPAVGIGPGRGVMGVRGRF